MFQIANLCEKWEISNEVCWQIWCERRKFLDMLIDHHNHLWNINFLKFPWHFLNFPGFQQNCKFPWQILKFPDFSLTLNFPDFSLTSGNPSPLMQWYVPWPSIRLQCCRCTCCNLRTPTEFFPFVTPAYSSTCLGNGLWKYSTLIRWGKKQIQIIQSKGGKMSFKLKCVMRDQ